MNMPKNSTNRVQIKVSVRQALFLMLIFAFLAVTQTSNNGSNQFASTAAAKSPELNLEPCVPGSGYRWTPGAFRPLLASQAKQALSENGIDATVEA
jgi:hypothetical protein